jgi:ACR3 family arsenite efflux pump ArsB
VATVAVPMVLYFAIMWSVALVVVSMWLPRLQRLA